MARTAPRTPETTPPDGPPREDVDSIPRRDPTAVPDPTPIDDPAPTGPGKTMKGSPLDREIDRLIKLVERRLH